MAEQLLRVVLVTGASRGFGRASAQAFAREASGRRRLHLVLVARDEAALAETAKCCDSHACFKVDLSTADSLQLEPVLGHLQTAVDGAAELIVVHNTGSLGPLSRGQEMADQDVRETIDLNVTSFMTLTNAVLRRLAPKVRVAFVNVSSLMALEPWGGFSLYCSTKAARDMYMRCVATDAERTGLKVRTLSYAPGPMNTDMMTTILGTCADEQTLAGLQDVERKKSFVNADASADKMVRLLGEDAYANGAHMDWFDP